MQCFIQVDYESDLSDSGHTILQFGNNWDLIANFVLLQSTMSVPFDGQDQFGFLKSKGLPVCVEGGNSIPFLKAACNPMSRRIVDLFRSQYSGGAIQTVTIGSRQHPSRSAQQMPECNADEESVLPNLSVFGDAPVVIGSHEFASATERTKKDFTEYVRRIGAEKLFSIAKTGSTTFSIKRLRVHKEDFLGGYDPTYTQNFGNTTLLGDLAINL